MSIARHHAEWLALLDISGPFLALPVLVRVFQQGLDAPDADVTRELRLAYDEWLDNTGGLQANPKLHRTWVEWVLRHVLELPDDYLRARHTLAADEPWPSVLVAEHGEELRPDFVIGEDSTKSRVLIVVVPPGQGLEKPMARAAWQASPATRMMTLLRGAKVRLGLLTNGEQWMLVDRPDDENVTTGFASWYARLWLDEPLTLRAFRSLLGARRLFGVPDNETLEAMLADSASDQQEVTDQLGYQVRRAVELLVQALDVADQNEGRRLLHEVPENQLYEAALSVMMRLVFLLFAEEQNLLLLGDDVYDRHYAASTLLSALREEADRVGEEVLERRHDAWGRLLAIFRAVYGGFQHDRLNMPAYGGSLFDPDRFPFLEGRHKGASWLETPADPPQISNRTVLHLLEALQVLRVKVRDGSPAEARRLSFRALDIEQIGHVYEGLLDHAAVRAKEPIVGLAGTREQEPELALADLERELKKGDESFLAYLKEQTGRSPSALKKAWAAAPDAWRAAQLRAACGNDDALYTRVLPFAGLVRDDDYGRPTVIPAGSVYVTAGTERRATGTHYTPRSLTEPIVQHTLEPLVYVGPAEGLPKEQWKLRPAADLLRLTICDMAMGSGAFLVQACRYLSERLMEAWKAAEEAKKGERRIVTPDGFPTLNSDEAIPADPTERLVYARRLVADRCLYGVDKNPLAVEMAKLSLWLITLAKGRPFSFLDHALRCGDSLLGISDLEQLMNWSLRKGDEAKPVQIPLIRRQVEEALEEALRERRKIAETLVREARDADLKAGWLSTAESALALVRLGADLLVAAELVPDKSVRETVRKDWLARYSLLLSASEDTRAGKFTVSGQTDAANRAAFAHLRAEGERYLEGRRPFHWPLEFPEVLNPNLENPPVEQMLAKAKIDSLNAKYTSSGFSAIMGNPPFRGGVKISRTLGDSYLSYILSIFPQSNGNADLCSHFLRRFGQLIAKQGMLGMIATNSIYQGETKDSGLKFLVDKDFSITTAERTKKWPGVAKVIISTFGMYYGNWHGRLLLDGKRAEYIDEYFDEATRSRSPERLSSNHNITFAGPTLGGEGFILSDEEKMNLIQQEHSSVEVIKPLIIGQDINQEPSQTASRFVIDFGDRPESVASQYTACWNRLYSTVRIQRKGNKIPQREKYWWQYIGRQEKLYHKIRGFDRILACGRVSKYWSASWINSNQVFSEGVVLFAFSFDAHFAFLNSCFHTEWAEKNSSRLKDDPRYITTITFETLPFPNELIELQANAHIMYSNQSIHNLSITGTQYHHHRSKIMLSRGEGLTTIYNRFHDSKESSADIAELRRLHVEMDNAVAAAYGWADLDLGHGFHETKQGLRYTISEAARREVLDRLLRLNHERYAEEVAAGLHDKGAKKAAKAGGVAKPAAKAKPQSTTSTPQLMFDLDAPAPATPAPTAKANGDAYVRLKALLAQRGSLSNGDVQAALGLDGETARALLQRLVEEGVAAVVGQKRGTRYVWRR